MKIDKNTITNKRILIALPVVIALLLVTFLSYSYAKSQSSDTTKESVDSFHSQDNGTQDIENDTDAKTKQDFLDQQKDSSENTTPPPADDVSTKKITIDTQVGQEGTIVVFTKLTNMSYGTCTLTVTKENNQKSYTADVIYQPDYSSCAGFSIKKSDLGSGTWVIRLEVEVDGNKYTQETTADIV